MIVVPKELQIQNIEGFLNQINSNQDDLLIPVIAKASYFGGLASAIQMVNTWARLSNDYQLIFQSNGDEIDSLLSQVIVSPYKFSAVLMAKNINLRIGEQKLDIKKELYKKAKTFVEDQSKNQYGFQRGNICSFSFVDHSSKGFDRNFYIDSEFTKPTPRKDEQISNIIRKMIEKTLKSVGKTAALTECDYEVVGSIFSELFKNTHEHGSRDINRDEWIRPAVRTIFTKTLNFQEVTAANMTDGAEVIGNYISSLGYSNIERRRFLELGIVDSGLGFYKRWLADHDEEIVNNTQTEYEVFKKCFSFRSTSSHKDEKGMGLPTVMEKLTEMKGFMKIRTGRLSLYRDFNIQPYKLNDDCEFYDWNSKNKATLSPTEMADTVGASITLLVPMGEK